MLEDRHKCLSIFFTVFKNFNNIPIESPKKPKCTSHDIRPIDFKP